jgi:predicted transcriptional regulator
MTGKELLAIRTSLALSQRELAWRAGVKENSVARQERGELEIRPALARLYVLLGHYREEAVEVLGLAPMPRMRPHFRRWPKHSKTARRKGRPST